jgi:hypothetical protein
MMADEHETWWPVCAFSYSHMPQRWQTKRCAVQVGDGELGMAETQALIHKATRQYMQVVCCRAHEACCNSS